MKSNIKILSFALFYLVVISFQPVLCDVKLPRLISDGMVLQRDTKTKIWGWADAGEKVAIHFNSKIYRTTTDPDGNWMVMLSAMKAGGPFSMEIDASNHIALSDILIGDVWVCSGQSNMDLTMSRVKDRYPDVIATSHNRAIRRFFVSISL